MEKKVELQLLQAMMVGSLLKQERRIRSRRYAEPVDPIVLAKAAKEKRKKKLAKASRKKNRK